MVDFFTDLHVFLHKNCFLQEKTAKTFFSRENRKHDKQLFNINIFQDKYLSMKRKTFSVKNWLFPRKQIIFLKSTHFFFKNIITGEKLRQFVRLLTFRPQLILSKWYQKYRSFWVLSRTFTLAMWSQRAKSSSCHHILISWVRQWSINGQLHWCLRKLVS